MQKMLGNRGAGSSYRWGPGLASALLNIRWDSSSCHLGSNDTGLGGGKVSRCPVEKSCQLDSTDGLSSCHHGLQSWTSPAECTDPSDGLGPPSWGWGGLPCPPVGRHSLVGQPSGLPGRSSAPWNSVIQSQPRFSCDASCPLAGPDSISAAYSSPTQPETIIKGAQWAICQVPRAGDVRAGTSPGLCSRS